MYNEITEYLKKIEELFENIDLNVLNEIEHILFQIYNDGYYQGMEDMEKD